MMKFIMAFFIADLAVKIFLQIAENAFP